MVGLSDRWEDGQKEGRQECMSNRMNGWEVERMNGWVDWIS